MHEGRDSWIYFMFTAINNNNHPSTLILIIDVIKALKYEVWNKCKLPGACSRIHVVKMSYILEYYK